MRIGQNPLRRGLLAAGATLAVGGVIAGASVAGAAQSVTIFGTENAQNGLKPCFSTVAGQSTCVDGQSADVTIQTGDSVTWDFNASTSMHNAASSNSVAADPAWGGNPPAVPGYRGDFVTSGTQTRTFTAPGTYTFVCQAHSLTMKGTIKVEGEPVEGTPTPTPTATATPTRTPTATATPTPIAFATATPDNHTSTPAPGHAPAKDREAPRLQRASVKRVAAGAQVRFWLSEPATVSIRFVRKGAKSSAAATVVQAPAGTRSFVLRTKALKKGTYTVSLAPVDAMGNKGAAASKSLKVK